MKTRNLTALALGVAALTALTACSSPPASADRSPATADVDAAAAALQPYLDGPTAFPLTEPLPERPAAGTRIALVDCGTPTCALLSDLAADAASALGIESTRISSGTGADTVATAFSTIVADGYDGVIVPSLAFPLWERSFDELTAAGIPVVTNGVTGLPAEIGAALAGDQQSARDGRVLADWVIAEEGADTDAVIYVTPELPFTGVVADAFMERIDELCSGCAVRTADIPVSAIGSTAASIVVDDLTASPDTTVAVFAIGEQTVGLPSALTTAGIEVTTLLSAPGPAQLAGVQDGSFTAALAADLPNMQWLAVDSLARLITGHPVSDGAAADALVTQLVTAQTLTGDLASGWIGYDDFAERYLALWEPRS